MQAPRVIFAGTPEFALASLQALLGAGARPVAVLTQPDRPAGRGRRLSVSPVKRFAEQRDIDVMQPPTLRDGRIVAQLAALRADILIVAAYGLLLPQKVLGLPRLGCLNVHASLLPRWRGAAPVQAALLAGDTTTGACLMSMTAGLDCGPVYVSETLSIGTDETAGELHERLAIVGAELLVRYLPDIVAGRMSPHPQDDSQATYAGKIKTSDAAIDWGRPAIELDRLIRAYNPVPGAYFTLDGERVKCWRAAVANTNASDGTAGKVIAAGKDGITVACGDSALRMFLLQRPGKRPVSPEEFSTQLDLLDRQL